MAKKKHPVVAIHGFGTYAILYRHMVALAKTTDLNVEWAMILPTSHHLAVIREVLNDSHILCLEHHQARSFPALRDLHEVAAYQGNLYADIEAEKKVFKHRRGREQVNRAIDIYRIYKGFLQRLAVTHVLLANIETFEGKVLVSLAKELGIEPMVPTDCRNLGGIFFSADAEENLPAYRQATPGSIELATRYLRDFRINPKPALNLHVDDLAGEENLPNYQRPFVQRVLRNIGRVLRNPQLFEPNLVAISFRNNFPRLRDFFRSFRARRNAKYFDIGNLDVLPDKFLYYPLQMTPESSINTPAPYFLDQIRAIDALRFSMPSDFTLVVKEHPACIDVRPTDFYRTLQRKAGVLIAHHRLPSGELIRRAGMTISVTGTATFEAFLAGRPSLVLGSSFIADYLGGVCAISDLRKRICHGLLHPPTEQEIIHALAEIVSVRYECIFRPPDEEGCLSARPSNVRRLLDALVDHLQRLDRLPSQLNSIDRDKTA